MNVRRIVSCVLSLLLPLLLWGQESIDSAGEFDRFVKDSPAWGASSRAAIVSFLKKYKEAICQKRLNYISDVLADNAIIIFQDSIPDQTSKANDEKSSGKVFRYPRKNKTQYLQLLESSFESNKAIELNIVDCDVKKLSRGGEAYGILLHQECPSGHDVFNGYFFLIVIFQDSESPVVNILTWQRERDPKINGSFSKSDSYYGLFYGGNFD